MKEIYFTLCNHWSESGIGFAFKKGYVGDKYIDDAFSSYYTIGKILEELDEISDIKVGLELDIYAFDKLNRLYPELIEKMKMYIHSGRLYIEGGTYGQPLGQDYSWESNIMHMVYGQKVVLELFGKSVDTFLVEEQWFHPQLPQIIKKSGFKYASLQWQNSGQIRQIRESIINWKGKDDSTIITIPSNQNMVSCVTQYYDYQHILRNIEKYDNPLIFQWVEVWAPGMDWGASLHPYQVGIQKMRELSAKFVTLSEYLDIETKRQSVNDYYISLNDANYGNDWYQGGGWGYNGDKIIRANNLCERMFAIYQNFGLLKDEYDEIWKNILMLQNHDASIARNYRCETENGVLTDADSYFISKYNEQTNQIQSKLKIINEARSGKFKQVINGYSSLHTYKLKKKQDENYEVFVGENKVESFNTGDYLYFTSHLADEEITLQNTNVSETVGCEVVYGNARIRHVEGFKVELICDNELLSCVELFDGEIYKANEHNHQFYSLSPDHKNIMFAFNNDKFCYDQRAESFVNVSIIDGKILRLEAELLNLRNTDQSCAKVVSYIFYDEKRGSFRIENQINSNVRLGCVATTRFSNLDCDNKYCDYPFGEESIDVNKINVNTYLRDGKMQIITDGSQRIIDNCFVLTKDVIHGRYYFDFVVCRDRNNFKDSINNANSYTYNNYLSTEYSLNVCNIEKDFVVVQRFKIDGKKYVRKLNISDSEVIAENQVDFYMQETEKTTVKSFEICTTKE